VALFLFAFISACGKIVYEINGEIIYKTGRNIKDEKLLGRSASQIKLSKYRSKQKVDFL